MLPFKLIGLVSTLFFGLHSIAQSYKIPQRLDYIGKPEFKADSTISFLRSELLIIGFSKDDKIAYLEEPADEACGCYFLNAFVKDLKTSKILWQWKYEGKEDDVNDGLKRQWTKNYKKLMAAFQKYKIKQTASLALKTLPIKVGTQEYDVKLKVDSVYVDAWGGNMIDKVTMDLKGKNARPYQVAQKRHAWFFKDNGIKKKMSGTLSCDLKYYIQNPFTQKLVLLYSYENRGWEGFPTVFQFELFGLQLKL